MLSSSFFGAIPASTTCQPQHSKFGTHRRSSTSDANQGFDFLYFDFSSCFAISRFFAASSSSLVMKQTFTVAFARLSVRTTLLLFFRLSHRRDDDNTFNRVIVLGIFDLVYHATVSTHMEKLTSMIQIEIAQSTDNNSMLGRPSDLSILQSNKGFKLI